MRLYVAAGLQILRDVGKAVNFEEMCNKMMSIPESDCTEAWTGYWSSWKSQFEQAGSRTKRNLLFEECISDLKSRGLMPNTVSGLSGNFNARVGEILSRKK